ncbi:cyclic nucleotide-gated ion channel 2-like isoform X2 [Amaranthus tricolor]|uniref:cyclic nucleotide-gated ion channel 2-like isoform X2 n=1 Tax=Amaranthus tricolor TaxID=29722 RepID=UPI0025858899|nr:cyclic nucleotide-gated ion channel 2-like isoform X2 [Amaranthus tricolor]
MYTIRFQMRILPATFRNSETGANPENSPTNVGQNGSHVSSNGTSSISTDQDDTNFYNGNWSNPIECYACTQVGVPVFHSTSCDRADQPEWEASAGSSLYPTRTHHNHKRSPMGRPMSLFGVIVDPRSERVRRWNRVILIARAVALAVDPVFFYALSIGRGGSCLYMDGVVAAVVTMIRTGVDAVHLWHVWLQFRLAFVSRESLVVGCGKLVWDARAIASHYVRSLKGFWFDLYVILPIQQVVLWSVVPSLLRQDKIQILMTILLLIFLFQFLPKAYHSLYLMRKMQKVTGYIFGTIWWGFGLNLVAYFIASHVVGGCWYILAIQRVAACLSQQCNRIRKCNMSLSCAKGICYQFLQQPSTIERCGANSTMPRKSFCLDDDGPFSYGIYSSAVPVISSNAIIIKILYPISWGLFQLSTFGNNLTPTSQWAEVLFCMCLVLGGLMLFTLLIGNIQVFLHTVMAKKRKMQLRCRDMEWWMRRRQLPSRLRHRVRHFERQSWLTTGGVDEMELIKDLPEGLRRDIKRYLCLDLMKKVPLFRCLDDLILDNICDRVKPLIYCKEEKIMREGDPVQRMVFIVCGRIKSEQTLSKGMVAKDILGAGAFLGDELLSWSLRRPFLHRLPASSATLECLEPTEAFGLDAYDLHYITEHFRYKFANESLRRTLRYHSSIWRTWAAVNIQFAWHRYVKRTRGLVPNVDSRNGDNEKRLLQFAAMFMSIRPHDHLD